MSESVEARIERVASGLLPEAVFDGRFGSAHSLAERMAYFHTPGISIAVINNSEIEWARGFGQRDANQTDAVTASTLFQAGSISKPIFALAVMRLVEQGHLDLDEDVNAYLRSWRVPANDGWQPRITLRQILSHTAGLTVHGFPGYLQSEPLPTVPQLLNGEAPANTAKVEVNVLPGVQFRYSGGGMTVAQQLLVDVLRQPFPDIMRELVLGPLGMRDSTYEQPLSPNRAAHAATAHPWKGIPLTGRFHTYPEMAAAGLWTTAGDLAKAGMAMVRALRDEPNGLFSQATAEHMLRPQLPDQKPGEGDYVGLGFFCGGKENTFRFGHGGWDEGFVADMRVFPHIGKGAVVMVNSNEGYPLLEEVMRAVATAYEWPGVFPPEKIVVELVNGDAYVGEYATKDGAQFRVVHADGRIALQYGNQMPLPLLPTSELEFFARAVNATVRFEKAEDADTIRALTLNQQGKQVRAERSDWSKQH